MDDSPEVTNQDARPTRSRGLTFAGLLVGAVLVTILFGQLTSPAPPPRPPRAVATAAPHPSATPVPDTPIGVDSIRQCTVRMGGLTLGDHLSVPGSALERWDCDGPPGGPWSVVIRAAGGHFGVHGAVVTFPVDLVGSGVPSTKPQGGVWNPGAAMLVWPLGSSYAQIVGDLGQSTLEDLATAVTVTDGRPHFAAPAGFAVAATIPFRSPVVHEMRYDAADLGQKSVLGDGLVFTGVTWAASFQSQAFEYHARPAGLVRGKPAIYSSALGGSGTLAWESATGEVTYIGFSGASPSFDAVEALRTLADKGRVLTPEQWETKDRFPVAAPSG